MPLVPVLLIPLAAGLPGLAQMSLDEQYKASHDPLTGLPNRELANGALNAARPAPSGAAPPFGLLDLDRFKEVNDTLGHHVGDQLLRSSRDRLSEAVRLE